MLRYKKSLTRFSGLLVLIASCVFAQDSTVDESTTWLPAHCVPIETIGLHDDAEGEEEAIEVFQPAKFKSTPFTLRENVTLNELLAESEDVSQFVTMQLEDTVELFEFACRTVLGANRELGYSCTNSPPSDILMINPKTMRFTRAAIGSWTFPSDSTVRDGSSLFVELGQCYVLESSEDSSSDSN